MNKTKFCIKCGKTIQLDAEFCPFCGSSQTNPDKTVDGDAQVKVTTKTKKPKKVWYKRWQFYLTAVLAVALCIGISFSVKKYKLMHDPDSASKEIKRIALNTDDFKGSSVSWDSSVNTFVIDIPEDSRVIETLYDGHTSIFDSMVRNLKKESNSLKKYNSKEHDVSYIQVSVPNHSDKILLAIDKGKIEYNISDDFH